MKSRRIRVPLILVLLAVFVVSSTSFARGGIDLTVSVTGIGQTPLALEAVAAQWNEDHPNIRVRVDIQPDSDDWLTSAPDTIFADEHGPDASWWLCTREQGWRHMSARGMLAPLDDVYEREGWYDAFPPETLDYYTDPRDGHFYGVQVDTVWTPIIYYNRDIFEELGLSEPATWDEFYAVTDALTDAGYIPLAAVYDMQVRNHLPQALMLRSWTQEEYDAFTQNWSGSADAATFDHKWTDPNSVRIFQMIQDMADRGVWGEDFRDLFEYNQAILRFTNQDAAMYVMGVWEAGASLTRLDFNMDFFFYPPIDGQEPFGVVGSDPASCYIVFQNRPHVEAAKQFVAYIISEEGTRLYMEARDAPPGRADFPPEFLREALHDNTVRIAEEVAQQGAVPLWEAYVPPDLLQEMRDDIDLMLRGEMTPEEVAETLQEFTEQLREAP